MVTLLVLVGHHSLAYWCILNHNFHHWMMQHNSNCSFPPSVPIDASYPSCITVVPPSIPIWCIIPIVHHPLPPSLVMHESPSVHHCGPPLHNMMHHLLLPSPVMHKSPFHASVWWCQSLGALMHQLPRLHARVGFESVMHQISIHRSCPCGFWWLSWCINVQLWVPALRV